MNRNNIFSAIKKSDKRRTLSVLKPSAQSYTLYGRGTEQLSCIQAEYNDLIMSKCLSAVECAVIELLMLYGLRISEVLRIKVYDIKSNGYIVIKGLKGSNSRLIYPAFNLAFWKNADPGTLPISNTFSRFYFYRLFKRLGLYERFKGHFNNSVTHYFRQKLLRSLKNDGVESSLLSSFIGHVSKKTIKYYEEKN